MSRYWMIRALNGALCALCESEYRRFISLRGPKEAQEAKLSEILRKNSRSAYGMRHDFGSIRSIAEFQRRVPLTTYEDYAPYIRRIMQGEQGVLTEERVLLLEPTGGSTSGAKLIPYTKSLQQEMQRGIRPWLYNLCSSYSGVKWGKSYWSVTPAASGRLRTEGGIPVGFEDDAAYFGRAEKLLLGQLFAVPQEISRESHIGRFYLHTALGLLKCPELSMISVWNPTFLLLLLDYIHKNTDRLLSSLPPGRQADVSRYLPQKRYEKLWPNLRVISCWCDANARPYARRLRQLFPNVVIQPKGLLATECFVTFPLSGRKGGVLSVHSHFFEFKSADNGRIYLAHQLERGKTYEVIVTTGGGFYRYQMRDLIRITGHTNGIPRMVFCGKSDRTSDLFGEKLDEVFVARVLRGCGLTGFALLAPETDRYVLYAKGDALPAPDKLDQLLRKSFHYDYCRKLGQLKAPRIFRITGEPEQEYFRRCACRKQKLGDIKPALLTGYGGWASWFTGYYADAPNPDR